MKALGRAICTFVTVLVAFQLASATIVCLILLILPKIAGILSFGPFLTSVGVGWVAAFFMAKNTYIKNSHLPQAELDKELEKNNAWGVAILDDYLDRKRRGPHDFEG